MDIVGGESDGQCVGLGLSEHISHKTLMDVDANTMLCCWPCGVVTEKVVAGDGHE